MAHFDLSQYETVEERLAKFWDTYPNGRVATEVVHYDEKRVLIKASLFKNIDDAQPCSTGFAEEVFGSSPVNKTSFVENCETSAIGRACANMNLSAKGKRPSREEMSKANRRSNEAPARNAEQSTSDAQRRIGLTSQQRIWVANQLAKLNINPMEYVGNIVGRQIVALDEVQPDEVTKVLQAVAGAK